MPELPVFEVLEPGLQTTVQDLGRPGLLATGMPPSGAFDALSLRLGNLLVGNDTGDRFLVGREPGAAGLELLLVGPRLKVLRETVVAVTGADVSPTMSGSPLPMWQAVRVREGDVLGFAHPRAGARAYLAVAGGIDVPLVLGSRSTNVRAHIGGVEGRALAAGDVLPAGPPHRPLDELERRRLDPSALPTIAPPWELRVVLGPQDHLFEAESVELFLSHEWRLSATSDRMGCRFVGPPLRFRPRPDYLVEQAGSDPSNIVDDAIPIGGIQVPSGVEPIAMGVDGPSIGGYSKIATVISADLARLGQMRPNEIARFTAVETGEAVEILRRCDDLVSTRNVVAG